MWELRRLLKFVKNYAKKIKDLDIEADEKDILVKRLVESMDRNLTVDEKVIFYKVILDELSYKEIVSSPEYMMKRSNVYLRNLLFLFIITSMFMFIAALLFSSNPIVTGIHSLFSHLVNIFNH